ncbi:MAG: glutamate--tRNA ligase [Candidatus Hydrogenedentota bacterium]
MIRVRIAPSPSGFLHIGTAKMALFNWLFARKHGGSFILRLEDTDADRTDEAFVQAMCEGFHWLGIDWDEGPPFGDVPQKGELGPYRQSQRKQLHVDAAERLVAEGKAYKCFCTKEEMDAMRAEAEAEKRKRVYDGRCNRLTPEEIAGKGDTPYVIRFRVPEGKTVIDDIVQGRVEISNEEFDDFVIVKPNGDPVFHLAVVVDDATMKISHVIRGDDHLTNAARHVMLFDALGYARPVFAHLPMVLDERGKKYSKREHGANVLDWRNDGYLPETMINYVALLGWRPSEEDKEFYTREELVAAFDERRWGKSAAKFDLKKLQWLNGQHIRSLSVDDLLNRVRCILDAAGLDTTTKSPEFLTQMVAICQEKLATLNDIVHQCDFFFVEPAEYDEKAVRKQWDKDDAVERMEAIVRVMESVDAWDHDTLKAAYEALAEKSGTGLGQLVHPTRLALTGKSVGPGLFELTALLGKETSIARMRKAMDYVKQLKENPQ